MAGISGFVAFRSLFPGFLHRWAAFFGPQRPALLRKALPPLRARIKGTPLEDKRYQGMEKESREFGEEFGGKL